MSSSRPGAHEWAKVPAVLAVVITALGAVLAAFWFLAAGLWSFSTGEYGEFVGITAIAAFLIGTPVLGFKLVSKGKRLLALVATVPALSLYGVTFIIALWA